MSNAKICDMCGKIIHGEFKGIRIENENTKCPVFGTNYFDVCPDCWKKIGALLEKEKNDADER